MPKIARRSSYQQLQPSTPAPVPQQNTTSVQRKKTSALEDAQMRKVSLYFVIGFCSFSELASFVTFLLTKNIEAAIIFQLPALAFFYRILCYLFPTDETGIHPVVALVQTIFRHKP